MSTDKDWERWGRSDPYFGVLSCDEFRKENLNEKTKKYFFASGMTHVERIFQFINENFNETFRPIGALDFGCGVGRITLPLANRTDKTVGVDISTAMIAEAAKNAIAADITNVKFILSDDNLTNVDGEFGLVHSYIVLQHIAWSRGRFILQHLAEKVEPGGYLAVHFLTSSSTPRLIRAAVHLRYAIPPLNWLRNMIKRRPFFEPAMQLHVYNISTVIDDLKKRNFVSPICIEEPHIDGFKNIFLFAHRSASKNEPLRI